jgi:hypothetical protein
VRSFWSLRTALSVAVLLIVAVPVAGALPGGGSGDDSEELCALLSPDLVDQATELSPPKKVKKAIKTLARYLEKNCADDATDESGGGDAESQGEDATGVDACEILTLEDAQTLAGTPLDPGISAGTDTVTCTYPGPVTGPTAQVEFFVGPGVKKALDIDRELMHVFTPVAGLGDEAYAEGNQIFWFQDDTWYSIRLVLLNDPAQNAGQRLEMLARKVSAEL